MRCKLSSGAYLRRALAAPGLAVALLSLPAAPGMAQTFPAKAIQMVVPYPAGGPADVLARAVGEKLATALKQPVVVANQAGAGGNLGSRAVAQAQPDGHTLLFTVDASLTANPALYGARMGFDPLKDLRPVGTVVSFGSTLAVHPSLNVSTLAQFLDLARKQSVSYASAGIGSSGQLTMELLSSLGKVKLNHIPYKGAAPAVNDMVGGQVQAGFLVTPGLVPHVRAGKLVALAVSNDKRSALLPQVPTVAEGGLPGAKLEFGMVLLVPAKTPEPVVRLLNDELRKAMATPELQKLVAANDFTVVGDAPDQAAARLVAETQRLGALVRSVGIQAE